MALSRLTWTFLISLFAGFVIFIVVIFAIFIPPEEHQLLLEIQSKIEKSDDFKQRIYKLKKEFPLKFETITINDKDYDFIHRLIHQHTGFKQNGTFIQSLIRSTDYKVSPSALLTDEFNWKGVILEPDVEKLFQLQEENVYRPSVQIIDACVAYTKESIGRRRKRSPRGGGRGGRGGRGRLSGIGRYASNRGWGAGNIAATQTGSRMFWVANSLGGYTRSHHNKGLVSCYSIDVIFKALNATSCDLLMLGGYGKELYILKTIPFDFIKIDVILVQLSENIKYIIEAEEYGTYIENYLIQRSFRLQWKGSLNKVHTYIFKKETGEEVIDNI
ncbi:S family protein [Megaselia abdita]